MVHAAQPVVGSLDEARDCASEAIVQYLQHAPEDVHNLEAFLVTIAKRRAIDHARARTRARARDARFAGELALSAPDVAEDIAARAEALWADAQARELLAPHVYELLQLVADGVPLPEVAQRLGLTERSVQSHLLRARRVVRAALARTLAALGACGAAIRRWSGPAGASASAVTAALVLAIAVSEPAAPAPSPSSPSFTLMPTTTLSSDPVTNASRSVHHETSLLHTATVTPPIGRSSGGRTQQSVVDVQTPLIGAEVQDRDDGQQSANVVERLQHCLQYLRIELHYQGCEAPSADQSSGQLTGDRPALPALG